MSSKNDLPLIEVKEISWNTARKDFLASTQKPSKLKPASNQSTIRNSKNV